MYSLNKSIKALDRIDRKILLELQANGRLTNIELAKRIGLSATPCLERVRKLEAEKVILGYTAQVDPQKVGAALLVFVEITLSKTSPEDFDEFSQAVQKREEIQECHLISGSFDFLLKTRVANMAAYRELLGETLLRLPSVKESRTYVVMEEVKQTTFIAVNPPPNDPS
ncbi:leucine-responsive transcriptional regulator Lrp [Marinagarivorans algicola]|uniref:leucine-responsive transcriptional regulator Lrp n=1 Tax=Marinagarivorans algicola TaxID=1513270 RepID=UPI0006B58271|nr:leucine-responsive transcriptional regulator Lrp [Marinagarivorans algicola]